MSDPLSVGFGAIGATKSALEVAKTMLDLRDAAKLNAVKFELNRLLLEAIEAQTALVSEKRELEERIRQLEAWSIQEERYQLTEVGSGTFAYVIKSDAQGADPPHMACANCFEQKRRSIIQRRGGMSGGHAMFICTSCQSQIAVRVDDPPRQPIRRIPPGGSWMGN